MAEHDKAVAAALREFAAIWKPYFEGPRDRPIGGDGLAVPLKQRADELDPPPPVKSRADRIIERYGDDVSGQVWKHVLRRILKEEGIE